MKPLPRFPDRSEAGRQLGRRLAMLDLADPVVLALPRGGVPVAVEIAGALRAPLDLVLVRKIGVPDEPELAVAAVVDGGAPEVVVNDEVASSERVTRRYIDERTKAELAEIERRRNAYLQGRPRVPLEGRAVVLVDDGIATGASIRAAIAALRRKSPARLVLAVPVAPRDVIARLRGMVDGIVCLATPEPFHSVGTHYENFDQLSDAEVIGMLRSAALRTRPDSRG